MVSQLMSTHIPLENTLRAEILRVILVHGIVAERREPKFDQECDSSENLLDVLVDNMSVVELGRTLPDPIRIVDLFVFQRLVLASRWRVPIPLHRLSDTMTDPAIFLFAQDLIRRGYEEINPDAVKNSIKRLRAVFRLLVPTPRNWFIRYEGRRGYLADLTHFTIQVIHLPQ